MTDSKSTPPSKPTPPPVAKVTIGTAGPTVTIEASAPWRDVADRTLELYREAFGPHPQPRGFRDAEAGR